MKEPVAHKGSLGLVARPSVEVVGADRPGPANLEHIHERAVPRPRALEGTRGGAPRQKRGYGVPEGYVTPHPRSTMGRRRCRRDLSASEVLTSTPGVSRRMSLPHILAARPR